MDSPSGLNHPAGDGSTPDRIPNAPGFGFPLPFDPVRLLAGVLTRWPWLAISMLVCGALGVLAGIHLTNPTYAISASLIKRRVPQTVQTSEVGQSFRPVDLNDATLLATLLASEPLDMAAKRAKNGIPPAALRGMVEAKQLEGTDIFYVTYHSPVSPQDAISFASIWAEEINAYTQRLQQTEAREVRFILQNEVADLEKQLNRTHLELLNFSKDKDFLGGESQVSAALAKLSQIDLQLETARTNAAAKEEQLKHLTDQIHRQSPIELQLKTAKEELANLRATYTDANPLVQSKLQSLEYLTGQIKNLPGTEDANIDAYTGTPLGNQLYLSIIEIRNELSQARNQVSSLSRLKESTEARISEFPAIISAYNALIEKRDTINESLSLMSNRLKEAEIFASGAPGYWQVFQSPDPRSVVPSSLVKKPAILGIAGAVAGAVFATLLTLLLTQRSSRRSILECCATTRAPLTASIPTATDEAAMAAIEHFWITRLAPQTGQSPFILFWTSAIDASEERRFWSLLAETVMKDRGSRLTVHDLTPDTLWSETPSPAGLVWTHEPREEPGAATLLRASSLPGGPERSLLGSVDCWFAIVAGRRDSLRLAETSHPLASAYLSPCNGTIAWIEKPQGAIREAGDLLSGWITRRFS